MGSSGTQRCGLWTAGFQTHGNMDPGLTDLLMINFQHVCHEGHPEAVKLRPVAILAQAVMAHERKDRLGRIAKTGAMSREMRLLTPFDGCREIPVMEQVSAGPHDFVQL